MATAAEKKKAKPTPRSVTGFPNRRTDQALARLQTILVRLFNLGCPKAEVLKVMREAWDDTH